MWTSQTNLEKLVMIHQLFSVSNDVVITAVYTRIMDETFPNTSNLNRIIGWCLPHFLIRIYL